MKHLALLWAMVLCLVCSSICPESALATPVEIAKAPSQKLPKAAGDSWVVTQATDFGDDYAISFNKGAIKFATGNYVVIAKEPNWQVSLLNQKAKVFWTEPLEQFRGVTTVARYNVKKLSPSSIKAESPRPKIAGQLVTISEGDCRFSEVANEALGFAPSKVRLWTATEVPLSSGALQVLGKIIGIEGLKGIPLQIKVPRTKNTEDIYCLQTLQCLNQELDKKTFDIPESFSKGTSFNEVETDVTLHPHTKTREQPASKN